MRKIILSVSILLFPLASTRSQTVSQSYPGFITISDTSAKYEADFPTIQDFRYIPQSEFNYESNGYVEAAKSKAGIAMLSSAIIPGSGQAMNGKWGRAAAYFLVDVASILYYINRTNTAKRNERDYERYANQNWSVVAYGQWLVAYSRANSIDNGFDNPGGLQEQVFGEEPDWIDAKNDWRKVDLNDIRAVEVRTPFIYPDRVGSGFSHVVQDYGSQQYYELMSKYYQFVPGWRDFYESNSAFYSNPEASANQFQYSWNPAMGTTLFDRGTFLAAEFNDNYRQAGNILRLMLLNHVVSAFDAYFTVTLKNSRIETQANLMRSESLSITWRF